MTPTFSDRDTTVRDAASRRASAINDFLRTARALVPDPRHATAAQLRGVATALEQLGLQADLFPDEQFPVDEVRRTQIFRLAEDLGGQFALYLSAGLPGKAQPPHDHTTWAIISGVSGNERNVVYERFKTDDAALDRLEARHSIDVVPGASITLMPADVHTIELIGNQPGKHLHFYGLGLDRLHERVVFADKAGGTFRTFPPPRFIGHALITPLGLQQALGDGQEIAVLDVRETGVFTRGHLLWSTSAPLWRLELLLDRLVPRVNTRIVVVDADESLAHDAAAKLVRLGRNNVSVLQGGIVGWAAQGLQLFTGTNVPSKAFGEVIEHQKHTPSIDAIELRKRVARGDNLVVVDSRTTEEFGQFSLPFAHSLPGAELVYRIGAIAPDPSTLVVVNCAGRTRSIVGAQTLIDAGVPNPVVSLKDGTMAWLMSGQPLARGRSSTLPEPSPEQIAEAASRAQAVAQRARVTRIDGAQLARLEEEAASQTLYRFDIRTRAEYVAGHLAGWRWAPGGQLVQATDEYIGTRHARIVLADWDGARALTTAAWLMQLGGYEVFVFTPESGAALVTGPEPIRVFQTRAAAPRVGVAEASQLIASGAAQVFEVDRRAAFERRHIEGARFAVPDRLSEFVETAPTSQTLLLTSPDGVLAQVVAAELAARTGRDVRSILGGTDAWVSAGLPTGAGAQHVLTADDDAWYSPYAHDDLLKRDAAFQQYLDWEIGLVAQLAREGDVGFRLI